ncbi:MAG: hypothetical protein F4X66_02125 [Chloroflexi bacterium]|nr:hypothetical protein [Chloroflexota bacterium]MYE41305.1 hypothetical protein [Chloroflexota bacterium]
MMENTLGGFCRILLDDDACPQALDPEQLAARFVDYFRLSARPSLEELTDLAERAGFGTVREGQMDGLKGAHIGQPGGEYHIYHRDDLWEGSKAQTVLHEMYEITLERMDEIHSPGMPVPSGPNPVICRQAERFAAAALMQPDIFLPYAQASGLDVAALHDVFGCAYSSAALRLAEVVRDPPLMVVLYEREERGDPEGWTRPPGLAARVVKRTAGFGARRSWLLNGRRGGMPRKEKALPAGSLAEKTAHSRQREYAEADGLAVIAKPVFWKGHLAKVVVVVVPYEHRGVLQLQLYRQTRHCQSLTWTTGRPG